MAGWDCCEIPDTGTLDWKFISGVCLGATATLSQRDRARVGNQEQKKSARADGLGHDLRASINSWSPIATKRGSCSYHQNLTLIHFSLLARSVRGPFLSVARTRGASPLVWDTPSRAAPPCCGLNPVFLCLKETMGSWSAASNALGLCAEMKSRSVLSGPSGPCPAPSSSSSSACCNVTHHVIVLEMGEGVIGDLVEGERVCVCGGGEWWQRAHHYNNLPDSYATVRTKQQLAAARCSRRCCSHTADDICGCCYLASKQRDYLALKHKRFVSHAGPHIHSHLCTRTWTCSNLSDKIR